MSLALLLLSMGSVRQVMSHAPAFNQELTITTLTGQTRTSDTTWMYDKGSYLFQAGHGFLYADLVSFAGIEAQDELATVNVARARLEKARDLLKKSINLDPANGHAWQAYAQALMTLGELSLAQDALRKSWELAPHNTLISIKRLYGVHTLRLALEDNMLFADIVASDKAVLSEHAPRSLKNLPL